MLKRRHFAIAALGVAALLLGAGRAQAGIITWGTAQNISGDTDVKTDGTSLDGVNFGSIGVTDTTVNGVLFTGAESFGSNSLGSSSSPFNGLSPAYQELLSTGAGLAGVALEIDFIGLTIGHHYEVEFWSNNSSTANTQATTMNDGLGHSVTLSNNTAGAVGGLGQFVVGTFTADSTIQQKVFFSGNGFLNGYQERDITPAATGVPEPASLTMLGLGALGLCSAYGWRKRKQPA